MRPLEPYQLDCEKPFRAVEPVSRTLERLSLYLGLKSPRTGRFWARKVREVLGPMTHFSRLQSLEVPWVVLFGWSERSKIRTKDILPESIQHLTITHYVGTNESHSRHREIYSRRLISYVHDMSRESTSLQSITLDFTGQSSFWSWKDETKQNLERTCQRAGLDCTYLVGPSLVNGAETLLKAARIC